MVLIFVEKTGSPCPASRVKPESRDKAASRANIDLPVNKYHYRNCLK
jgi:hypothetical protein